MNITVAKQNSKRSSSISTNFKTSNPFKPEAKTIYENTKEKEMKEVRKEIARASLETLNI